MDKRVVVFLVLSLGIILGFDVFLKQMGWFPEPPPAEEGTVTSPSSPEQKPAPTQSGQKSIAPSSAPAPSISEQTVTVETDLVRVGLSNRGGVIQSLELKR